MSNDVYERARREEQRRQDSLPDQAKNSSRHHYDSTGRLMVYGGLEPGAAMFPFYVPGTAADSAEMQRMAALLAERSLQREREEARQQRQADNNQRNNSAKTENGGASSSRRPSDSPLDANFGNFFKQLFNSFKDLGSGKITDQKTIETLQKAGNELIDGYKDLNNGTDIGSLANKANYGLSLAQTIKEMDAKGIQTQDQSLSRLGTHRDEFSQDILATSLAYREALVEQLRAHAAQGGAPFQKDIRDLKKLTESLVKLYPDQKEEFLAYQTEILRPYMPPPAQGMAPKP